MDNNRELGFPLTERKSRRYPAEQITDTDYADDIAVTSNPTLKYTNTLILKIESSSKEIRPYINTGKTEYININHNNMQMKSICGNVINQVEDFKYLGIYIIIYNQVYCLCM